MFSKVFKDSAASKKAWATRRANGGSSAASDSGAGGAPSQDLPRAKFVKGLSKFLNEFGNYSHEGDYYGAGSETGTMASTADGMNSMVSKLQKSGYKVEVSGKTNTFSGGGPSKITASKEKHSMTFMEDKNLTSDGTEVARYTVEHKKLPSTATKYEHSTSMAASLGLTA